MKGNLTLRYCLHQCAYWAAAAGILTFATTFLLAKDFPASQVGVLMACGSMAAAKEKGLVRSEGKEYVVQDGDVILFRFNV